MDKIQKTFLIGLIVMAILTPIGLLASGTAYGEWGSDELKDTIDKKDAIKLIIDRLSKDITFQDMITYDRCYFSKKIRKK